ncbi:restriction endonuclease [Thioflexithrix psekupsensis]|uniref:Restriction endonuclease n=2 Tax=Thioflexithrix psekupsensis TaxID=1570016 RepID=A0A251X666_9GAMM|nr:restriction endonuclease [Thioflexithrix psekupsensis]
MDLIDHLQAIALRIENTKDIIQTEEATKNAFIMPFIQALGYNVFDPLEVTPELAADIGTKKGEKVDYAILKEGKPILIFECKKCGAELNINHAAQLFRYFHVTEARFAVLTNGIVYQFFTDLEQPNKMDEKPFLEFNILDFRDSEVEELSKFAKTTFDVEKILTTANELKYARHIKNILTQWMTAPSDDFIKLVAGDLIAGKRFTPVVREQFAAVTARAFQQLIAEKINTRLKIAMSNEATKPQSGDQEISKETPKKQAESEIVTTTEEWEGFFIIRSILRELVDPKRITMRDALSYCAILFDDNNRKPICRLRFNNPGRLVIGFFNTKEEEKVLIPDVNAIYNYADRLKASLAAYLK